MLVPQVLAHSVSTVTPEIIPVLVGDLQDHPKYYTPKEMLFIHCEKYGCDYNLGDAIITCESGWVRTAQNPGSSASGFGQFLDSTWHSTMIRMGLPTEISKTDPYVSIQAFAWLLATDGSRHWNESRPCWQYKI